MEYKDIENVTKQAKTVNIKGSDYVEVNERVKMFRKLFPSGTIQTELISNEGTPHTCIFKASVLDGERLLATGYSYEKENSTFINQTSYIENCETSAVGRALGFLGIGIDASIASADEVQTAIQNQSEPKAEPKKPAKKTQPKAQPKKQAEEPKATAEDVKRLQGVMAETGYTIEDVQKVYGVTSLFDLTKDKLDNAMERMQAKMKKPAKADRRAQEELLDLQALMADTGVSIADIMKEYKVERLDELSEEQYQDAMARLTDKLIAGSDINKMAI